MITGAVQNGKEAWDNNTCTYAETVCTMIHEVRTVSADPSLGLMTYGMLQATQVLDAYSDLDGSRHTDESSASVIASPQREGTWVPGSSLTWKK